LLCTRLVALSGVFALSLVALGCGGSDSDTGDGSGDFRVGLEAPLSTAGRSEVTALGE